MRASVLAERGYDVTWRATALDRLSMRHQCLCDMSVELDVNYRIELLHAPAYRENVSLERVLFHNRMAQEFARCIREESPLDMILSSLPTPEMCKIALDHSDQQGIPVVVVFAINGRVCS